MRNLYQILFGLSYRGDGGGGEVLERDAYRVWWGNLRERV